MTDKMEQTERERAEYAIQMLTEQAVDWAAKFEAAEAEIARLRTELEETLKPVFEECWNKAWKTGREIGTQWERTLDRAEAAETALAKMKKEMDDMRSGAQILGYSLAELRRIINEWKEEGGRRAAEMREEREK